FHAVARQIGESRIDDDQPSGWIKDEGERVAADGSDGRAGGESPVRRDAIDVDRTAAVALHGDDELAAIRREADLGWRLQEGGRIAVAETERALRSGDGMQFAAGDAIALDVAGKPGIQHVGEVAVYADAGRERATGRD